MEENIENSLSMGGEGAINNDDSEQIELPNISEELPNLSDTGSDQFEALKQSAQNEGGVGKFLQNSFENIAIDARDAIDNVFQGDQLSREEIRENRAVTANEGRQRLDEAQQVINEARDPISEGVRAITGGLGDAVESVGSFASLTKDTIDTGAKTLMGKPVNPEDNPFSEEYQNKSYFEIPDVYEPEMQTNIGKFARGLVEFGFLTRWTGGVGGFGLAKTGLTKTPMARSVGAYIAGNKKLQFLTAGAKISAEGSLAELISESSEYGNIANLAEEYVPWLLPGIMEKLAVDEDDTSWEARLKTVTAGAGLNHVGYFFSALIRGGFKNARTVYKEAIKKGKSVEEAVDLGNTAGSKKFQEAMLEEVTNAERAANKLAEVKINQGLGIDPSDPLDRYIRRHLDEEDLVNYDNALNNLDTSNINNRVDARGVIKELEDKAKSNGSAKGDVWDDTRYSSTNLDSENAGREPDPIVNPDQFDEFEKVSYAKEVNAVDNVVEQAKKGDNITSTLFDEADIVKAVNAPVHNAEDISKQVIKRVSGGDKNIEEIYTEVIDDITKKMSQRYSSEEFEELAIAAVRRAEPILQRISDFTKGDVTSILQAYRKHISTKGKLGTKEYRRYSYGLDQKGKPRYIDTIGPIQVDANIIILKSLAQTVSNLAQGSLQIQNKLSVMKNFEKIADLMKYITIKTKESQYAWGIDGQMRQGNLTKLDRLQAKKRGSAIKEAADDADKLHENLIKLMRESYKTGDSQPVEDLMALFMLTDGDILALEDVATYFRSYLYGGNFFGYTGAKGQRFKALPSKLIEEAYGVMYNGLLGRISTPIKAILSTGYLATAKPMYKLIGAISPFSFSKLTKKPMYDNPEFTKRQVASALFQLDMMTKSLADTFKIFIRNYRLGLKGREQDYIGKYNIQRNQDLFKGLAYYKNKYAGKDPLTQTGWFMANIVGKANSWAFSRHSVLTMGAGDAAARYIIGMQRIASEAFEEAMDQGISIENYPQFREAFENLYRKKIFRQKKVELADGKQLTVDIVSDRLARLGGDQATLTENLEGLAGQYTRLLNTIPGSQLFFKFLTPSVNGIKVNFDHSPAALALNSRFHAMMRQDYAELRRLGINERTMPGELAEIEGKWQFGTALLTLMTLYALSGRITGDLPRDKGEREMWQQAGIKPNSFVFGVPFSNKKVYVGFKGIEIFSAFATVVANLTANAQYLGETEFNEAATKLISIGGTFLTDNGPLSGLEDFANLFSAESAPELFGMSLANVGGSFTPYSGQAADFHELIDGNLKELESLNDRFLNRGSVFKPLLTPRYNIYNKERVAKELTNKPDNLLLRAVSMASPVKLDFEEDDIVTDTLVEIRYDLNANLTQIDGIQLTGPEQSEIQRILATDKEFRKELLEKINSKPFQDSLKQYKEENRKINRNAFSKDGFFGLLGDQVGGFNYKNATFYKLIDDVHTDAKKRAIIIMQDPTSKFGDLSDPNSFASRLLNKNTITTFETDTDVSASEINEYMEDIRKKGI